MLSYYVSETSGIFIHYLPTLSAWAVDDGGASYIQQNDAISDVIPTNGVFLDYSTLYSAVLNFSCGSDVTQLETYISDVYINGSKDYSDGDVTGVYLQRNLSQPSDITMVLASADSSDEFCVDQDRIAIDIWQSNNDEMKFQEAAILYRKLNENGNLNDLSIFLAYGQCKIIRNEMAYYSWLVTNEFELLQLMNFGKNKDCGDKFGSYVKVISFLNHQNYDFVLLLVFYCCWSKT